MSDQGNERRAGREIGIESPDGAFRGYLAEPASGRGPGLVVLQEWWGLVPQIRDVCDRFARAGWVALAPDLYRGDATADPDEASRLMMALEIDRAGRDLQAAVDALLREPACEGATVGCIGFCMGGQLALQAACLSERVGAVVDCYGVHPEVEPDLPACRAKVLGVFAEHDEFVPTEAVERLRAALEEAGVDATFRTYSGVGHAFLNEARPEAFDAAKAAEAWRDIDTFLAATLR